MPSAGPGAGVATMNTPATAALGTRHVWPVAKASGFPDEAIGCLL